MALAGHVAPAVSGAAARARLAPLHEFEERARRNWDFAGAPSGDRVTGADPFLLRALPGSGQLVGLLRGAAEVVLLDTDLKVVARAPAPRSPTGLAVTAAGEIFVSGELSDSIVRYAAAGGALRRTGAIALGAGRTVRDIAVGPEGLLYAVDERAGRLIILRAGATAPGGAIAVSRDERPVGLGPMRVARIGPVLLVDCLLDHAVVVLRLDRDGRPIGDGGRVQHDGPIWSFDGFVARAADHLLLAVGGVEDHPLDRTVGAFGYIDSFVTLYRIALDGPPRVERLAAVNVSALGVVTPKVIALSPEGGDQGGEQSGDNVRAVVTGYGSATMATLVWPGQAGGIRWQEAPSVTTRTLAPGTTSLVARPDGALALADPLLDAWLLAGAGGEDMKVVPAAGAGQDGGDRRGVPVRVGEALFFTTLMSPWGRSDGPLSRFTCETCHFEGYVDGRTHHTGRGDVHATTKPLRGLFNNRPYFSRALDPDLTTMVDNEFRVAGQKSGHDPWFAARAADFPWLRQLGVTEPEVGPLALREALMSFLMTLSHQPNPAAASAAGARFNDRQRAGAAVFHDRCEGCHQARLVDDDPESRVPFAGWETLIMSESGPLVWGLAEYRKTGIAPYVHENGARVPSLRRLYKKRPYFTNGSAKDLDDVIARARFGQGGAFQHDAAAPGAPSGALDAVEAADLRAFLDLL